MELKEGYKQTEVGVIPEDWEPTLLDSVAKRGSGHTPSRSFPEYWNGEVKWISLQDSHRLDNGVLFDTEVMISEKGLANSSAKLHPAGTVVLSRDAGVGKSAIMGCDMAVSQHFMAWIAGNELDNFYLYYWLQITKPEFERIAIGNTIKTIGLPYFKALKVPLPPTKAEQEAIAEALSDADALIEFLEQLISKKRQIKQGAMQELLTGKKRLPGFSGEWEVGSFAERVRHHSGDSSLIKGRLSTTPISGYHPGFSASGQDVWLPEYRQEGEALIVSAVGSRCGKCFRAKGKWSAIANTHIVWPTEKLGSLDFLMLYLNDEQFWVRGGTGQPFVKFKESFAQIIGWPDPDEQTAIAIILSDMDAEIAALETKLAKARQVKQGMMQELLTGNIRLVQPENSHA